jgi:HK97 gp10 family phage protein
VARRRVRLTIDPDGWKLLQLRVHQLVTQITDDVYFTARSLVPVDTGELMGTLRVTYPAWNRGRVWVGSDHWSYNEYGTSRMDAQPFMRPAIYRLRLSDLEG